MGIGATSDTTTKGSRKFHPIRIDIPAAEPGTPEQWRDRRRTQVPVASCRYGKKKRATIRQDSWLLEVPSSASVEGRLCYASLIQPSIHFPSGQKGITWVSIHRRRPDTGVRGALQPMGAFLAPGHRTCPAFPYM